MNDKNNNSNSEDKPYSDSLEMFDTIFSEEQVTEDSDSKKKYPPDITPSKTVQQKAPQKVKRGVEPQKKTSAEKTTPSAASAIVKPTHKADVSIKKSYGIDKKPVKAEIAKKLNGEPKKSINAFIFASAIVVLVVLSMFTGKVMDYDAIMNFFKGKDSLKPRNETVDYNNRNKKSVSISTELDKPSLEENVPKPKTEELEIQSQDKIKEKQDTHAIAEPLPTEQVTGEKSVGIKGEISSYPYSIYLGSYSTITKVNKASSDYTKMGLSPYWVKLDLRDKGVWFRLFAGYFQTRKEADEFINVRQIPEAEPKLTKYANLIGIYTSLEELGRQKAILEKLEYCPYVISDTENVFRLYVGVFYQKVRAKEQKKDLALQDIQSELVER